ncbi:MAG: hypothetical protein RML10_12735 [Geminocystis sp.]|nr:hypothetical protein [Geminocystis sp.]
MKRPTFFIVLLLTAFWTEEIKALETKAQSFQPDSLTQDFENVWFLAQANGVNESSPLRQ